MYCQLTLRRFHYDWLRFPVVWRPQSNLLLLGVFIIYGCQWSHFQSITTSSHPLWTKTTEFQAFQFLKYETLLILIECEN